MVALGDVGDAPLVRLCDAEKRYRHASSWVLRDINVAVARGCLVEVRGANGSGKSTLLRMVAGATLPTRGRRLAAKDLGVGYGPERLAPAPPFPASAYLAHHARLRRLRRGDHERQIASLATRLGLTSQLMSQPLRALSKGSLQKVVVIQALVGRPALVVLLDEPFAGLDRDAAAALVALIGEATAAGSTVVFSDHRERETDLRSDVIWSVSDGGVRDHPTEPTGLGLPQLPGLLEAQDTGAHIRMLVAAETSDQALTILVQRGWHIIAVAADSRAPGRTRLEAAPPRQR